MNIAKLPYFVGVLTILALSHTSIAQTPPAPVRVITGIATTSSGKPAAGQTLYLLDLPGSQYLPSLGERGTVVTDAQGHFTWTVPADVAWNVQTEGPLDSATPACYIMPIGAGWRTVLGIAPNYDANTARRDLMEKATLRCQTHWLQTGANPQMSVVVPNAGLGTVTLRVSAPDGQPLGEHAVQVVAPGTFSDYEGAVIYEGQTDGTGRLHLRWKSGLWRFFVSVPGVGFGSTGTFQVLPAQVATPSLPPLAPFARVSGTVALPLLKPGAFVHMQDIWFDEHKWYDPHAAVDAQGRFTLEGVLPGQHNLILVGGQKGASGANVTVYPGEQVSGVVLGVKAADAPDFIVSRTGAPGTAKPSVQGHVTDAAGKPVEGADVYALCSYQGAIRQYQEVLTAKTDASGAYLIPGLPVGEGGPSVSLVAVHAGYPVATASAQAAPEAGTSPNSPGNSSPGNFRADLVLPSGHPGLTVRVLQGGKPLAGASVRLTPQSGTGLFGRFYVGSARGVARDVVDKLLEPTATTNANGETQFTDLAPGLWNVTAASGNNPNVLDTVGRWGGGTPQTTAFSTSQGLIVGDGQVGNGQARDEQPRTFTVSVYSQPNEVSFRVLSPEGKPPPDPAVAFEFGLASSPYGSSTSVTLDKAGTGKYSFAQPGLWSINVHFRDTALDLFPASAEPFYEGSALFAVSPALPNAGPVLIRTVRRGPGSIRVRVVDSAGRPRQGAVFIGDTFDNAKYGASLNARGEAVFADMPSGQYMLRASFDGQPAPPELGKDGQAFPADAALTGISLLDPQTVTVRSDEQTLAEFRPQPQGYVRGRVNLPAPDLAKNYSVFSPYYSDTPPTVRYDLKTGEFVAGPFPAGKAALRLQRTTPQAADWEASGKNTPVDVETGRVVRVILSPTPPAPAVPAGKTESMLTMGGVFSSNRNSPLTGTVYLPDGTTPAWGARAALVVPETWQPVQMARTDALGRLNVGDYWYTSGAPASPPPGSPSGPVLVAWLPGANGAVVIPYVAGQEAHLVLPAPAALHGRVLVAGHSVVGLTSSFRVLAAYQGHGKLNPLLSVEATAQADGTFDLGGLSPGTYRVQAARDGIWLSGAQTLVVGSSALPELTLDIAPPGAPIILHLTDEKGKAVSGREVSVLRPPGPLTDELWPKALSTDSAGQIRLEGLGAGKTELQVSTLPTPTGGNAATGRNAASPSAQIDLSVPPATASSSRPETSPRHLQSLSVIVPPFMSGALPTDFTAVVISRPDQR